MWKGVENPETRRPQKEDVVGQCYIKEIEDIGHRKPWVSTYTELAECRRVDVGNTFSTLNPINIYGLDLALIPYRQVRLVHWPILRMGLRLTLCSDTEPRESST